MDAQVNFKAQEQAVEGFVNALQELKAMMKSINDLPITRLRGVEKSLVTPMQEAVGKLAETGTAMVNQFKQIGQKSGEALEASAKSSISKATTQVKQALAGHYDALGNFISTASAELKAKTDKAAAAALMLDTGVVRQATQQSMRAMSGHYNALGVYVDARSKELQAKAEANQAALARVYAKLGSQATGDTGARMLTNPTSSAAGTLSGKNSGVQGRTPTMFDDQIRAESTALKNHLTELERVANLKAQIKARIESSDVAFKPASSPRMTLDQKDAQYAEAMAAMRAQYSPAASTPKAAASEATQATLRAAAALRDKAKASTEMAGAATKSGGALRVLVNHLTDVHSAARGVASGFGMMWLTWGKLTPLLAGAALSNSLVQTAQRGKEFETVLAGIEYMGGASADEIRKLSAAALEFGANSKYAPLEVAQSLKVLTLAGLNATESLQALKPMLNFATVSELPLDKAAESLLGISKAFGYTAAEVSVSGDVVAKAAAVSMSSVADMTEAFKLSSTVAQQFGVTIQDQSVGLALLAQIGIRGSAAGTALRNMYVELMGSSKKARKVLEETLNVNIFDNATKAVKPLSTILTDLAKSLSGKTFEAQTNILNALGNERGMKMISAGLSGIQDAAKKAGLSTEEFVSQFAKLQKELEDAPSFMAVAAAGMSATTENIMKSVSGSLQSSMIKAFEEMSPYLINFSVALREVFQSQEFIQGLKDLVRFVGEAAQGFAAAVKFVWEYREAILAAGAGLLALKASTTVLGVMSAAAAGAAGTVRMLAASFLIAGPAGFAGAAGATAMAGAVNLLKVALGPIAIALSAAAAAYYFFADSAEDASKRQKDAVLRDNEEMKKSLEVKRSMTLEAMDKEIERLQVYIKHKGDEKEINKEMKKLADEASVSAVNSTIQKLLDMAQQEEAIKRVDAATKRVLAAEIERDRLHGGGGSLEYVERLRKEADALDEQGRMIRAKGEFEANVARQRQVYMSKLAKEAAGIANTNAGNRRKPVTGDEGYNPDDKTSRDSFDTKIRLEAEQVTARYRIEMEAITSAETLKANLLKSLHNNKLIMDGEFAAREIALVESTELRKLDLISRSRAEYEKKHESDIESLETQRRKFITENSGKKGFDDKYAKYVKDLVDKFDDLHSKRETHLQDFDKEAQKVQDSAIQRWAAQVDNAAGRIKALKEASKDFWHQESVNLAKQARDTSVEDALRYADPEQAVVIQAQSAAYEQYAGQIEDLSYNLTKAEENHAAMTAAIDDSLLAMVAEGAKAEDVAKVKGLLYAAEKADLDEIIAKRERLAEIKDVQGEMVKIQGDRALTKFKKDEEAQLIKGVADAVSTGLFEGGKAGKRKLRDLVVAELRKPISLLINAIVNPVMGAMLGSLGIGSAAAGQAGLGGGAGGGSLLGTAGTLSSAYNAINGGITNSITAGFNNLASSRVGQSLGLSVEAAGPSLPGMTAPTQLTSFGQTASSWATTIGGTMAGIALGSMAKSLISGGYSAGKGMDTFQNIGVAVGSAIGGPLVGAIIGAGAGVFNRAFGRKLKDQGIQGEFGGEAGFTGENFQFYKGGWFRSDKTKTSPLDADMQSGLANQFKAIQLQTALMASVLGDSASSVASFTKDIKISFNGLTEGQISEKLTETFAELSVDMAQEALRHMALVSGQVGPTGADAYLAQFVKDGEKADQTLTRLSSSLAAVNAVGLTLGFSLKEVSLQGADAASKFIDLMGGMDAFTSASSGYYAHYYTEAERTKFSTEQLAEQFKAFGQVLPTTGAGFREMVEAAESAGDSQLLAKLLSVQGAFAALVPSADDLQSSLSALRDETEGLQVQLLQAQGKTAELRALELAKLDESNRALQQRIWAIEDETKATEAATSAAEAAASTANSALEASIDKARQFFDDFTGKLRDVSDTLGGAAKNIRDYLNKDAIGGGPKSLQNVSAAFESQLVFAKGGDREALAGITGYADTLIQSIRRNSATQEESNLKESRVRAKLAALPSQVSAEQYIVDAIDRQTFSLSGTLTTSFTRLDTNVDGLLTFEELKAAGLATDGKIGDVIAALDANGDGQISAIEALKGTLSLKFDAVDTSLNGLLSYDEFSSAFVGLASDSTLRAIFTELDTNGDGQISRLEVLNMSTTQVTAAVQQLSQSLAGQLAAGFGSIDLSGNGLVDYAEFRNAFAGMATDASLQAIFRELDVNGDGTITRLEAIRGSSGETASNTYGLDKLTRISDVINSLQWGTDELDAASVRALSTVAQQQGWTASDMSNALGRFSGPEIADFFAKYGSSITVGGINSATTTTSDSTILSNGIPRVGGGGGGFAVGGGGGVSIGAGTVRYRDGLGYGIYGAAADRLDSINGYVDTLDWSGDKSGAISALTAAASQYGVSIYDLSISTGYSQADLAALLPDVPRFAAGGMHTGGLRLVGENGPELEITGPARYMNTAETMSLLRSGGANNTELLAEMRAMREDNQAQARAMVQLQQRLVKLQERWDANGLPETRVEV